MGIKMEELHEQILDKLLQYKEKHPDFTFYTRRRNKSQRLENGYWFLGNEDYINIQELLKTINKRIEFLYDRDHTIGHAYFIGCNNFEELQNIFKNKIIPLLQEYFYDDWEKINLLFNNNEFIKSTPVKTNELFSNCNSFDEFNEDKKIFSLNNDALGKKDEYVKIYT